MDMADLSDLCTIIAHILLQLGRWSGGSLGDEVEAGGRELPQDTVALPWGRIEDMNFPVQITHGQGKDWVGFVCAEGGGGGAGFRKTCNVRNLMFVITEMGNIADAGRAAAELSYFVVVFHCGTRRKRRTRRGGSRGMTGNVAYLTPEVPPDLREAIISRCCRSGLSPQPLLCLFG
ncbi:unnamed protein product [Ilex paraguariensis]|uniref:Uncharacterized protein n=1 Tax=Ilex paraguariensis TaxID=185542 RepID=A0ABC8THE9_9AQUA